MKKIPSVIATDGDVGALSTPMPQSGDFSLYFHIPFCTKKCDYCHFFVLPNQERFHSTYLNSLKKEWDFRAPSIPPTMHLTSIYFGGGTPALLKPEAIEDILSWISPDLQCEITLEANPDNVSHSLIREFRKRGINRISLGVQSLDDPLLRTLSRTHSAERSLQAVAQIAEAGIENISIDLMYDLPNQSLEQWSSTLKQAVALPITHISLYNLSIEPHTVFYKKKHTLKLPDQEVSLTMLNKAVQAFNESGFERYEISAFAREGKKSRHNLGYWTKRPFLGFGPSACSYWEGCRFRNISHLNKYAKALNEGEDPADFKEILDSKESIKEGLAIGLRLIEGLPIGDWPEEILSGIAQLHREGLIQEHNHHISLTEKGLLFHDTAAEMIMSF